MNDLLYMAVKFYFRQYSIVCKELWGSKCQSIRAEDSYFQNDGNFLINTESINFGKKQLIRNMAVLHYLNYVVHVILAGFLSEISWTVPTIHQSNILMNTLMHF